MIKKNSLMMIAVCLLISASMASFANPPGGPRIDKESQGLWSLVFAFFAPSAPPAEDKSLLNDKRWAREEEQRVTKIVYEIQKLRNDSLDSELYQFLTNMQNKGNVLSASVDSLVGAKKTLSNVDGIYQQVATLYSDGKKLITLTEKNNENQVVKVKELTSLIYMYKGDTKKVYDKISAQR